ncbi:hypothetical protein BGX21_005275 [Mortierella sp. AD011]|nr:hypothetical protein BGX21_005275 [Mortierella sp. AD011]
MSIPKLVINIIEMTEIEDDYEWESSNESGLARAKDYIPWVLEQKKADGVSFMQKHEFMNLEDAKSVYELFLSNHLLKLEKRDTKTKFRIVATKSARKVQSASMEITENANSNLPATVFLTELDFGSIAFLSTIDTNPLPRTHPEIEYHDESAQSDISRSSNITPSKRKDMF